MKNRLPDQVDVCVIGSGAGGGPVAWYLAMQGYQVVVLERGWWLPTQAFRKDELGCCRRDLYVPHTWEFPHEVVQEPEGTVQTTYQMGISFWNATLVGGATNIMSGMFHRMKPLDFRLKEVYGPIPDSTVENWPLSYADLEPFYTEVEQVAGISGKVIPHPFQEPRSTPDFPFPPLRESIVARWLDESARSLGFQLIPTPRAILSRPVAGRRACYYSGYCGSYGCASDAKSSSRVAFLLPALETGNLLIIPRALVYFLEMAERKVHRIWYIDANTGEKRSLQARAVVVACGPIESVRLLLMSRNPLYPYGIGNHSGNLGKHLLFSSGSVGVGYLVREDFSQKEWLQIRQPGLWINRTLIDLYEIELNGKPHKGGIVEFMFEHMNPVRRAIFLKWDQKGNLLWGEKLRKRLYRHFREVRGIRFEVFCDWTPTEKCYVELSPSVQDKFGFPVARIHIFQHPHDRKVDAILARTARTLLEKMGCQHVQVASSSFPPVNLVAGGCRMSSDARRGVTDPTGRVHETENLFIADSAPFVTGGSVPYTWTIYAWALRVARTVQNYLG